MHWNTSFLAEAIRWERRLLRIAFRMKPRPDGSGRAMYNQRTAMKLDKWMSDCRYKQIHVAVLNVWHERTVAAQLAAVRRDRDLDVWEAVKDITAARRRKEQLMHSSSGPQMFGMLIGA